MNKDRQAYNSEDIRQAFKTVADRLKNAPKIYSEEKIEEYGCLVCKHFWSKESYDYQWGNVVFWRA